MPTTPVYGWPYQSLTDPPDGPNLGEDLALAIESTITALAALVPPLQTALTANSSRLTLIEGRPVFRGRQTVVQSLANATFAPITLTTEDIDTANGHDTAVNPARYVFPLSGYYLLGGQACFDNNATNQRGTRWNVNGSALNASALIQQAASGNVTSIPAPVHVVQGTAGQYVQLEGWQNMGGSLSTFVSAEYASAMTVVYLRAL